VTFMGKNIVLAKGFWSLVGEELVGLRQPACQRQAATRGWDLGMVGVSGF
jgi:hypothetical protein